MTANHHNQQPKVTAALIAEASAWLAILHGPNRTSATEQSFSQWLKISPSHAQAFEEATGIWEEARNLPRPRLLHSSFRAGRARSFYPRFAVAAAVLVVFAVATVLVAQNPGVATDIGEQRLLTLDDGTRVILNTNTRIVVSYDRDTRRVDLKEGEALFEVSKKSNWPFVVTVGNRKIEALGTAFAVRREAHRVAVTLVEGKVAVSTVSPSDGAATDSGIVLTPGERVVFAQAQPVQRDHPQLEKLLAWQRREVALDNTVLSDAVAEMNRYNRVPLIVESPQAAQIRVTGLFRAGDSLSFARAVAEAYKLQVVEGSDLVLLSGVPAMEGSQIR